MSDPAKVIQTDDHGEAVRCSCCARDVPAVVRLPILDRPLSSAHEVLRDTDGNARWLGLCLGCLRTFVAELEVFGEPPAETKS